MVTMNRTVTVRKGRYAKIRAYEKAIAQWPHFRIRIGDQVRETKVTVTYEILDHTPGEEFEWPSEEDGGQP